MRHCRWAVAWSHSHCLRLHQIVFGRLRARRYFICQCVVIVGNTRLFLLVVETIATARPDLALACTCAISPRWYRYHCSNAQTCRFQRRTEAASGAAFCFCFCFVFCLLVTYLVVLARTTLGDEGQAQVGFDNGERVGHRQGALRRDTGIYGGDRAIRAARAGQSCCCYSTRRATLRHAGRGAGRRELGADCIGDSPWRGHSATAGQHCKFCSVRGNRHRASLTGPADRARRNGACGLQWKHFQNIVCLMTALFN